MNRTAVVHVAVVMYGQDRVFARGLINVVEGDMVISKVMTEL